MKITAVCATFNRPALLGRVIECFNRQDYADRELVIFDDAGQYGDREGDRWRIVSVNERFPSLGDKRNELLRLVSADVDAVALWDDDDIYLPWALSASVAALEDAVWAQPRQVLKEIRPGELTRVETFNRRNPESYGYPGGWSARAGVIEDVGGYPSISNGEDAHLAARLCEYWGPSADTLSQTHPTPGYIYNHRRAAYHISGMGRGNLGWEKLAKVSIEPVNCLDISWPADYCSWPVDQVIRRRQW